VAATFAGGVVGISFAALFVRWALPAPPITTAFYRMALASTLLGVWLALRREGLLLSRREMALALAAGACFGADLALWHTALVRTSLANATLLVNTTPVYVGLVSWALGGEPLGRRFAAGTALALGGTAALVGIDWGGAEAVRGDLLALGAALFYSAYLLGMKAVRRTARTLAALAVAGAGASATLLVCALVRGDALAGFPASSWAAFVGAALVAQVTGVVGIVWSLRYLRAAFASLALLAQPVGTALLGWWLVGEALSAGQALGGAAIAAGILLASRSAGDPAWRPGRPGAGAPPAAT